MEIERLLAASIEEERQMKEYQMNEIKKNWECAIQEKQEARSAPKQPDFDPANCGPASLQKCSGEDANRIERLRAQKNQMRNWVQEQMSEKAYVRKLQRDEDLQYAEMIKAIDAVREQTEREEQELRKYVQNTMKSQNTEVNSSRQTVKLIALGGCKKASRARGAKPLSAPVRAFVSAVLRRRQGGGDG